MHEHIAKSGNFVPINFGMFRLGVVRQALCRFRQRLKVAQHGILNERRGEESVFTARDVAFNTGETLADVDQIKPVVFHNGLASAST